jgi:hypothetical protein
MKVYIANIIYKKKHFNEKCFIFQIKIGFQKCNSNLANVFKDGKNVKVKGKSCMSLRNHPPQVTSAPIAVDKYYTPFTAERNTFLSPLQQEWEFANTYSVRVPDNYLETLRQALLELQEVLVTEQDPTYEHEVATDIIYIHVKVARTEIRIKYIKLRPCVEGCNVYQLVLEWFMKLTLLQRPVRVSEAQKRSGVQSSYTNFKTFLQEHCLETNESILKYYGFRSKKGTGNEIDCYVTRKDCETYDYSARFRNDKRVQIVLDPLSVPPKYTLTLNPSEWISAYELNNFHETQKRYIGKLKYDITPQATFLQQDLSNRALQAYMQSVGPSNPQKMPTREVIEPFFEAEKQNKLQRLKQEYPYPDHYVLDYTNLPSNVRKVPGIDNMEMGSSLAKLSQLQPFFDHITMQRKDIQPRVLAMYLEKLTASDPLGVCKMLEHGYAVPPKYLRLCARAAIDRNAEPELKVLESYPDSRQILKELGYSKFQGQGILQRLSQIVRGLTGLTGMYQDVDNSSQASAARNSVQFTNQP